jgi:hypothetical protein|tara:strand:- start:10092 stop:10673 length:582 start_codon:yes stop_codon:yes gene_type:complete
MKNLTNRTRRASPTDPRFLIWKDENDVPCWNIGFAENGFDRENNVIGLMTNLPADIPAATVKFEGKRVTITGKTLDEVYSKVIETYLRMVEDSAEIKIEKMVKEYNEEIVVAGTPPVGPKLWEEMTDKELKVFEKEWVEDYVLHTDVTKKVAKMQYEVWLNQEGHFARDEKILAERNSEALKNEWLLFGRAGK